ncbi:hypothetical protein RRSWK_00355 [Rhodopirellula sp. SWK7]|nr:hypothetical protein RRSWK_00355 [Rhodopirellula sp. SWK7]
MPISNCESKRSSRSSTEAVYGRELFRKNADANSRGRRTNKKSHDVVCTRDGEYGWSSFPELVDGTVQVGSGG